MIGAFSHADSPTDIMTHLRVPGSKGRHSFRVLQHVLELAQRTLHVYWELADAAGYTTIYFGRLDDRGDIPQASPTSLEGDVMGCDVDRIT
jgi:hypothetical protein